MATYSPQLQPFGQNLWIVDGPDVNFFGLPYPTRMALVRLKDGSAWIWSPTELTDELASEIEATVGPVRHLVSPNKIHWIYLRSWKERYPDAKLYASPGLAKRRVARDLQFDATLTNVPDPAYAADIDQIIFETGVFDEVEFFHKPSKTAIVCDLIQRFPEETQTGIKGWLMRADGMVGPNGMAPGELRFIFWIGGYLPKARTSLNRILNVWQPDKLVIAHGENAKQDATQVIANSFRWIPANPRECCGCCHRSNEDQSSKEE